MSVIPNIYSGGNQMKVIKNSTRLTALILSLAAIVCLFGACSWYDEIDTSYTGTTLYASLGDMPTSFDPMYAYLDDNGAQMLSLIYSGLFRYDENGKAVKDMCKSYEWVKTDDESGEYIAEFEIVDSAWSDTVSLTSKDFIFAWRRILDPGNTSEACSLLYDIKNAREVKTGDKVPFELGAYATSDSKIRLEFTHKVDLDAFIENLASPALVPLREDIAGKITDWSTTSGIVVANGPFYLKTFKPGALCRFERNRNYLRDSETDNLDKYVTPYRVVVYFGANYYVDEDTSGTAVAYNSVYELYNSLWKDGFLKYYASVGSEYSDEAASDSAFTSTSKFSTHTYIFNESNPLFADARVRKALSLAIDRTALVDACTANGTPAKGIVPAGVYENGYSKKATTFRDAGEDLIGAQNLEKAKSLLKEAGVTRGSFVIKVRGWDAEAVATAEYIAEAWNSLGFTVTVRKCMYRTYSDRTQGYDDLITDTFFDSYKNRRF